MSFFDNYLTVRDRLTQDVAISWGFTLDQIVWVTQSQAPEDIRFAKIQRQSITFAPENGSYDEATITLKVSGRFMIESGMDIDASQLEKSLDLRSRIVYGHYTELTYAPIVTSILETEDPVDDQTYVIDITLELKMSAERTLGTSHDLSEVGPLAPV